MPESAIKKFLRMTLALAEKGRGQTSPNPMVGAVIVKNGKIVGQGYHKKAGGPHAEIIALKQAGGESKGATLYINLEPCCHFGRTNPCTDTIVEAGIREVVYAIKDPNPRMNGQGANMLKKAGLKVSGGYLREDAERLNEAYLKFIRTGRPFVTLKMAQSLDGQIATITGDSKWISGMAARRLAHRLRAENDAVVIGAGTVLTDNPCLTVRLVKGNNPYRIIISRRANFEPSINLFRNNGDAKTILATSERCARKLKINNLIVWIIKEIQGRLSLDDFLDRAGAFGIQSLLVEGGSKLATSLLKKDLIDKHILVISPMIIGRGMNATGELNIRILSKAIRYKEWSFKLYGTDILFVGYPRSR